MKLKRGPELHDVVRRSETSFQVDGVMIDAPAGGKGSARSVFVVRDKDRVYAQVDGRAYTLTVLTRAATASSGDATAIGGLEAPMPGRVTRVAVSVGDSVKRGQELVVVEAMKMENALVAPVDGKVKSLAVKVGDMVAPGPALVVIEPNA